jgi:hypothetical protein
LIGEAESGLAGRADHGDEAGQGADEESLQAWEASVSPRFLYHTPEREPAPEENGRSSVRRGGVLDDFRRDRGTRRRCGKRFLSSASTLECA